jgi:hypothetical protein
MLLLLRIRLRFVCGFGRSMTLTSRPTVGAFLKDGRVAAKGDM